MRSLIFVIFLGLYFSPSFIMAYAEGGEEPVEDQLKHGSKTDDQIPEKVEMKQSRDDYTVGEKKIIKESAEDFEFQAEVHSILGIIINSLYTNKEIFLRELISNASDALDKIRFLSLTKPDILGEGPSRNLEIKISWDYDKKELRIMDTGIGMTKKELITNLGTLAKSGSKDFIQKVADTAETQADQASLIGQFGVGFYSVFLVANQVEVISKSNDDDQHIWISDEKTGGFTIIPDPRGNTMTRGTEIILHVKPDAMEYLDTEKIESLVKKYSEFIDYPIYQWGCKIESEDIPIEKEEIVEEKDDVEVEDEDEDEDEDYEDYTTVEKEVCDWEHINKHKPIWTRPAADVSLTEYNAFYEALTNDPKEPLFHSHFSAEGDINFKSILYIPSKHQFDGMNVQEGSIKLYVRRVFITDKFEDLMPRYLSFIKGVIDSDDLPLNISRENLSHSRMLKVIRRKLIRKSLEMCRLLLEDPIEHDKFYGQFGTNLKFGMIEDPSNRTRISKLLRFRSTHDKLKMSTLDEYVERMPEGQKEIYYIVGEKLEDLEMSPFLEKLKKKGYECLYLTAPVDEPAMNALKEYEGFLLRDVSREGIDFGEDKDVKKAVETEYEGLLKWIKDLLPGNIYNCVVSWRLTMSPSALSTHKHGYSANMQRILKAQSHDLYSHEHMKPKKVLEIHPHHPIVMELKRRYEEDDTDPLAKDVAKLLYDTALLTSGFTLDDPIEYVHRAHRFMKIGLGMDPEAETEDYLEWKAEKDAEEAAMNEPVEEEIMPDEVNLDIPDDEESEFEEMVKEEL